MQNQMKDKAGTSREEQMRDLSKEWNIIYAYVYQGGEREEYVFKNTAQNIAAFIGRRPNVSKMILTDIMDLLVVDTIGNFIDHCPDKNLLEDVKRILIPIQMGQIEAPELFCPTKKEYERFVNRVEEDTYAE